MTRSQILKTLFPFLLPLSLASCQGTSVSDIKALTAGLDNEFSSCINRAVDFRRAVDAERVVDASARAIEAMPLLHSNRFLSHLALSIESDAQRQEWIGLASQLGQQIRAAENKNLAAPFPQDWMVNLNACADRLVTSPKLAEFRHDLIEQVESPPDNYAALPQWLGFNGLLKPIFQWRIQQLHQEEKQWFEQAVEFEKTVSYELTATPNRDGEENLTAAFAEAYGSSALKVPILDASIMQTLFEMHAPDFIVEFEDRNDLIGAPIFVNESVVIDSNLPTVFTLPSFTKFGGSNLLQLNYVIWFSERKAVGWPDLYAGKLDSLIWRVTLDEHGDVLLYDSIHSCGCYHKYFIASDQISERLPSLSREPANIFNLFGASAALPADSPPASPSVYLTANEHYIVGVEFKNMDSDRSYRLDEYKNLSNLPGKTRAASLFSDTGIIKTSKRLERFSLWPTGIESVGAMRQWGTHATGFVQQQQFDEATLFDNYFIRAKKGH